MSDINIEKGMEDPVMGRWVELQYEDRHLWLPLADFAAESRGLYGRLANDGFPTVSRDAQSALRDALAKFSGYTPGRVADRPGWYPPHYVLPNGEVISPEPSPIPPKL